MVSRRLFVGKVSADGDFDRLDHLGTDIGRLSTI